MVAHNGVKCEKNVPSNLADDATDESGALAQVALVAGHARLSDAGGGLLYFPKEKRIQSQFFGSVFIVGVGIFVGGRNTNVHRLQVSLK